MRRIVMLLSLSVSIGCARGPDDPILAFGAPPSKNPEVFAPGFVSTEQREHSAVCLSPDGREIYFTRQYDGRHDILWSKWEGGVWSVPEPVPFTSDALDDGATFSQDGRRLYFGSRRGTGRGDPPRAEADIWFVERIGGGWGEPVRLGEPISTSFNESFPSFTSDGAIYFHSDRSGGSADIYRAEPEGGGFGEPVPLDPPVNTDKYEAAPFVSPDGSYILYMQVNLPERDERHLYLSRRLPGGGWSEPVDLAERLGLECSELVLARVSPCGRYLFILDGGDIKWVDARVLEQ
jgi:hypothetical protein